MFNIHQKIERHDEIDEELANRYTDGLMEEFANSEEAKPIIEAEGSVGYANWMMDYAINYIGSTPPEMTRPDFDEVVFDLFPRKVSTPPETAPVIIAELRAFWTFLRRQYNLKNADAILASLKEASVEKLRSRLADPRYYGMAKSFMMSGMQAGFDMTTQEGLDAYMRVYNSGLMSGLPTPGPAIQHLDDFDEDDEVDDLDEDPLLSLPPSITPKQRAKKRSAHKAQRQARKRNRKK